MQRMHTYSTYGSHDHTHAYDTYIHTRLECPTGVACTHAALHTVHSAVGGTWPQLKGAGKMFVTKCLLKLEQCVLATGQSPLAPVP